MTTYQPAEGVFVGRPPCVNCGAAWRLHEPVARPGAAGVLRCPVAYRPDTLDAANRALDEAIASGDQARIFAARGDVQRLGGPR